MKSEKNILVLAEGFGAPAYTPRLRSLCEYLVAEGYGVDVVVEKIAELPFAHSYPIEEVELYRGSKTDWALKNIWSILTDWKNRAMSRYVEQKYGQKHYDAVYCTSFHTFPLRAAIEFGEKHGIPVTLDLRDIVEQAPKNQHNYLRHSGGILNLFVGLFTKVNLRRRNRWLKRANQVISVSPWHVETLKQYNPKTMLVYNGYDDRKYRWEEVKTEEFILSYTGKFFDLPLQDPTMLFEALQELKEEIPYRVVVHSNPRGEELLRDWAKQYGVEDRAEISGYIPTDEAIQLYHQSAILLIFSNTASDETVHGMMTTKFFEALGVEKPVLCVKSDEEVLAAAIEQTHAGLAATEKEEVKEFIRSKYAEWREKGYTRQEVIGKEQYSRQSESKQILEGILADR